MTKRQKPKITVITVCYQAGKTLEQTIQSVLAQTYSDIEYLVIDGGSTDNTAQILSKYKSQVSKIVSEKDKGIYDAMNKGISLATGDIIGFLNADDLFMHTKVIEAIEKVFSTPNIQACYADLIYFKESAQGDRTTRYFKSSPFKLGAFAKGWCPPHPTFYVRKSVYQQYGHFDLSYKIGNDVELMMRFLEKEAIQSAYLPETLVKMRVGGVSNQSLKNIYEQNKNILLAAKKLNIHINPIRFTLCKVTDRVKQFLVKPKLCRI